MSNAYRQQLNDLNKLMMEQPERSDERRAMWKLYQFINMTRRLVDGESHRRPTSFCFNTFDNPLWERILPMLGISEETQYTVDDTEMGQGVVLHIFETNFANVWYHQHWQNDTLIFTELVYREE